MTIKNYEKSLGKIRNVIFNLEKIESDMKEKITGAKHYTSESDVIEVFLESIEELRENEVIHRNTYRRKPFTNEYIMIEEYPHRFTARHICARARSSQTTSTPSPTPSPTYEWVQLQSYDTGKVVLLKFNEPLDTFELPRNTQEFKVEIEWMDGSKDNSLGIGVFMWDSVQDEKLTHWTNIDLSSINSTPKSGTKTLTFDKQTGKFYVNIASAADVRFTIDVFASVPS